MRTICLFFLAACCTLADAQVKVPHRLLLAPVRTATCYGVKDTSNNILIPANYEALKLYTGNFVCAKFEGRWGLLDLQGKWVIEPRFTDLNEFKGDYAVASVSDTTGRELDYYQENAGANHDLYGLIDRSGKWKVRPAYSQLVLCEHGLVIYAENKKWGLMNTEGKIILKPTYSFIFPFTDGIAVIIQKDGDDNSFYDNWAQSSTGMIAGGKWGLMNEEGKVLLAPVYDYIGSFQEGLAAFNQGGTWSHRELFFDHSSLYSGSWGFLNRKGQIQVPARYTEVKPFMNGVAFVNESDTAGYYINTRGEKISKPPFQKIDLNARKEEKRNKVIFCQSPSWGFVDTTGTFRIKPLYGNARTFHEGLAAVTPPVACEDDLTRSTNLLPEMKEKNLIERLKGSLFISGSQDDSWGFVDASGSQVIPFGFEKTGDFSEGLAAAFKDGLWGFIDTKGNWQIEPRFDGDVEHHYEFRHGMALIRIEGRWGFVDKSGKQVIPAVYSMARDFEEDYAAVKVGEKWGFIDRKGKLVIAAKYETVGNFSGGLAFARRSNAYTNPDCGSDCKFGYLDKEGKWVIQPRFDWAQNFSEGLAAVEEGMVTGENLDAGENAWGYIDKNGTLVIAETYTKACPFHKGIALVFPHRGKGCMIDRNGKVLIAELHMDTEDEQTPAEKYKEGYAAETGKDGLFGFRNKKRVWAVQPVFLQVLNFSPANKP